MLVYLVEPGADNSLIVKSDVDVSVESASQYSVWLRKIAAVF